MYILFRSELYYLRQKLLSEIWHMNPLSVWGVRLVGVAKNVGSAKLQAGARNGT